MRVSLFGAGLIGPSSQQLVVGLTNALCTYGHTAMNVTTIDVGTAGTGKGVGFGVIVPQPLLVASLSYNLPANSIGGISAIQLILGIATGYSLALSLAGINTTHPSVGVGSGKLQIKPNTAAAIGIYQSAFLSAGLAGLMAKPLALAVATSLDAVLPLAIGFVAIAGPPNIVPSTGFGTGKLL